jgi:DNA-binding protein Fis
MFDYRPEPPVEPPEDKYITDVYGCEVYDGEEMYVPHNNVTNKYEEMSVQNFTDYIMDYVKSNPNDAADLFGIEHYTVRL